VHDDTRRRPLPLAPARSTPSPITTAAPHDPHPTPARMCKMYHIAYQSHTHPHRIASSHLHWHCRFLCRTESQQSVFCAVFSPFHFLLFTHYCLFYLHVILIPLHFHAAYPAPRTCSFLLYFILHTYIPSSHEEGWMDGIGARRPVFAFPFTLLIEFLYIYFSKPLFAASFYRSVLCLHTYPPSIVHIL
jgi:hypothetical protein